MLACAKYSFAVGNARQEVKAAANYIADYSFNLCIRAKIQVNLVCIMNQLLGILCSKQIWQISAYLIA